MKAVGIDIGTTTISAVVISVEHMKVIEAKTIQNESFIKTEHDWERIQDVTRIMRKARTVLDELLACYEDVASIGLTGQMHGILYLNRDGRCISPLYTWQDGRGNLPEFEGKTLTEEIHEKCRISAATGYGLVTHLYNDRRNQIPVERVSFCTISDYFGMRLTGRSQPLLHSSMAASLGFFDSRNGMFRTDALQAMGVDVTILPEVTDEFQILGTYRSIPVTAALGDNQASFLGSAGMLENAVLLNMGTGGQISVVSDTYLEASGIEARPFLKGKYLLAGSSLCGGRAYAILERFFRNYMVEAGGEDKSQYDVMAKLAEKGLASAEKLKVVTAFNGTRVNPALRGSISEIGEENFTPEAMVYGVLKGMAQELYDMYQTIHEKTGIRAEFLVASGNGLRKNKTLQKIFSQMFQAELTLAPYEEEAAYGAAVSSIAEKKI